MVNNTQHIHKGIRKIQITHKCLVQNNDSFGISYNIATLLTPMRQEKLNLRSFLNVNNAKESQHCWSIVRQICIRGVCNESKYWQKENIHSQFLIGFKHVQGCVQFIASIPVRKGFANYTQHFTNITLFTFVANEKEQTRAAYSFGFSSEGISSILGISIFSFFSASWTQLWYCLNTGSHVESSNTPRRNFSLYHWLKQLSYSDFSSWQSLLTLFMGNGLQKNQNNLKAY